MVSFDRTSVPAAGSVNPLVNRGFWAPYGMPTGMQNGTTLRTGLVGISAQGVAELTVFDAWDWDCEGFGNPRAATRSGPFPSVLLIDLGADEMGELIMAGYARSTRIFSRTLPGVHTGPSANHTAVYFFNVYTAGNSYLRPKFVARIGESQGAVNNEWYGQARADVHNPPLSYPTSNYTDGIAADDAGDVSFRYFVRNTSGVVWGRTLPFGTPFMRSLQCDFAPLLLQDVHGFWGDQFTVAPAINGHPNPSGGPWGRDVYGSNPWFNGPDLPLSSVYDNPFVAHAPGFGMLLRDGTLQPPGSDSVFPAAGFAYLTSWPPAPAPFQSPSITSYSVGQWGWGDSAHGLDPAPKVSGLDWHGIRVNCELEQLPGANLQTWLSIDSFELPAQGGQSSGQSSLQSATLDPVLVQRAFDARARPK